MNFEGHVKRPMDDAKSIFSPYISKASLDAASVPSGYFSDQTSSQPTRDPVFLGINRSLFPLPIVSERFLSAAT